MRTIPTIVVLWLLVAFALTACSPAGTEPDGTVPTQAATAATPELAQATATAAPTATSEPTTEPTATSEPVAATPTAEPTATDEPAAPTTFCPEIARPALILFMPSDELLLFDPSSGSSCPLPIPGRFAGTVQLTADAFFAPAPAAGAEGDALVIQRHLPDGSIEDLTYTQIDAGAGASYTGFTVSPDARFIAWGVIGPTAGSDFPSTSLYLASLETGELLASVGPVSSTQPRGLMPIRFDESGSTLFYAEQPYGIGGSWIGFTGRYDTLYSLATGGNNELQMLYDCGGGGLGLCLGDFFVVDGALSALAVTDAQAGTVVVQNGEGQTLNTLQSAEEYVGYPTWGPGGELVYYTTDLADNTDGPPAPVMGHLHRVAPPTAPAETVLSDPSLALPLGFLNDTQVVVNWVTDAETQTWGLALVGIDGSLELLDVPTGASFVDIVR